MTGETQYLEMYGALDALDLLHQFNIAIDLMTMNKA